MSCGAYSDFHLSHFEEMLERALELGYTFLTFADLGTEQHARSILMRHDVDLSIRNAERMAVIEKKHKIRATYFVRVHAHGYNPFQLDVYERLRCIEAMGHEIGLHCEPGFSVATGESDETMLMREKAVLEAVINRPVLSCTTHLPGKTYRDGAQQMTPLAGFLDSAHDQRWLESYQYISDSNGRWRDGCLCQHLGKENRLHVTIHPFWWYERSPVENY